MVGSSGRPLFPVSRGVMAVANAFVMLGLLPEPLAEAILAEHRSALERQGFGDSWGVTEGELTVRPGAHGYWQSRAAGPAGLREVPVLVAAAGVRCPNPAGTVTFHLSRADPDFLDKLALPLAAPARRRPWAWRARA